jgi:hypothetical protein
MIKFEVGVSKRLDFPHSRDFKDIVDVDKREVSATRWAVNWELA